MSKYYKRHQACPSCGSSDALSIYVDGSTFCFSCRKATAPTGASYKLQVEKLSQKTISQLVFLSTERYSRGLIRGLTESTRRLYHYSDATQPDCTAFHYYHAGDGAYKLRYTARKGVPCKDFSWVGRLKEPTLFGIDTFEASDCPITICEAEIDAMSYHQITKLPAVSILNGAQAACDTLAREHVQAFLRRFAGVNLLFDADAAGIAAADAAYKLLSRAKLAPAIVKIADGYKDANELLTKEYT